MAVDSLNASEVAIIVREVGAVVFEGALRYPSDTGGWLVGDLDFCDYLDRYRNQQVMVTIAPLGQAPALSYSACGRYNHVEKACPIIPALALSASRMFITGWPGEVQSVGCQPDLWLRDQLDCAAGSIR